MKILVTGAAGFIGFHVVRYLLERGDDVVGLDNINDYYDVNLKYARLAETGIDKESIEYGKLVGGKRYPLYRFIKLNLEDREELPKLFERERFERVVNLAAQAGVRYSIENPWAYVDSNITGFVNILECCCYLGVRHLVYASSSSVYGLNVNVPFKEDSGIAHPVSLYAATKIQRVDGTRVQSSLRSSYYGFAFFHGIRSLGTPRHEPSPFYEGNYGRANHESVQSRGHVARFHLRG